MANAKKPHPVAAQYGKSLNRLTRKLYLAQRLIRYDEGEGACTVIDSVLKDLGKRRQGFDKPNAERKQRSQWLDDRVREGWERFGKQPAYDRASKIWTAIMTEHLDDARVGKLAIETVRASIRAQGLKRK